MGWHIENSVYWRLFWRFRNFATFKNICSKQCNDRCLRGYITLLLLWGVLYTFRRRLCVACTDRYRQCEGLWTAGQVNNTGSALFVYVYMLFITYAQASERKCSTREVIQTFIGVKLEAMPAWNNSPAPGLKREAKRSLTYWYYRKKAKKERFFAQKLVYVVEML